MDALKKLKRENKPWAVLGLSRREYETKRPWKAAQMSRAAFEDIALALPQEIIADIKLHAEAELLVESIFGEAAKE